MKNEKKGVLMVMSNANGWRSPNIFGGAEFKTSTVINGIDDFNWYVILPKSLYNIFSKVFSAPQVHYLPIKTLFLKTNVIKDLFQGLIYAWRCILLGWKYRDRINLIYSLSTNFSDIFPAKIISLLIRKPYIVKYHISIYDEPKVLKIYKNFREEKNSILDSFIRALLARLTIVFLKKAKCVLVVCKYLGTQLEKCGVEKDKIVINYNGLDFVKMTKFKKENIEKKYDICCMGRIEKNKGMQDLIEVVKIIKDAGRSISVVIVGDGMFLEELKKIIKTYNLEQNVTITGFLGDERYTFLQQSHIFVSPTYAKEGFGLTLLEALFFNVPIIAYFHPVLDEVFGRYDSVKLINQGQQFLLEAIMQALNDKRTYQRPELSVYSLENFIIRERNILSKLI